MDAWEDADRVETVVSALRTLLDGTAAAASSVPRNQRIMNSITAYALKRKVTGANPLPKGKGEGTAPKVAHAIDKRVLLNPPRSQAYWTG